MYIPYAKFGGAKTNFDVICEPFIKPFCQKIFDFVAVTLWARDSVAHM